MRLLARAAVPLFTIALLATTGCSGSPPVPTPSDSSLCKGEGCNGKDPAEIGCEADALSYTKAGGHYVTVGSVEGVLEIRKGKPSVCPNIYWARFTPANANDGSFEVTLKLDDTPTPPQKSAPDNPSIVAWTTVFYAEKGKMLQACARDAVSGQEQCTDRVSVE